MRNRKIFKNIDSILQVTKETVNKSNNYYEYIINRNNLLYKRQLPLLMKNNRINSLVISKLKNDFKSNSIPYQRENEENKENKENRQIEKSNNPLNSIRNIQTRSKKLPPLCPLYNGRGELVPSIIKSSKIFIHKLINYDDNINYLNCTLGFTRMGSTQNLHRSQKKIEIKKLKYNKSCDFDFKLDYDEKENRNFNEPEYDKLKYEESKIFGQKKLYEDTIKKKIKELQTVYNKNLTTKKEKIYKYGLEKRKLCLVLESLKVRINEIKDENNLTMEKNEKSVFEYSLPLALLPLFYFKGADLFLIILSKLIIYNESNDSFELVKKDDEIISNILKNCNEYSIDDEAISPFSKKEENSNDINLNSSQNENKKNNQNKYNKLNNNNLNDNKNPSLNNQFINSQSNSQINRNSNKTLHLLDNNNNENLSNDFSNNNINNNNINNLNKVGFRGSFSNIKKRPVVNEYEIYPNKTKNNDISFSTYEYFWITNNKSYILTIDMPLITLSVPSHKSEVKKYINYELLFYLYYNKFVMWDFYIIKFLSTYKNFRYFLEGINSIPERKNIFFYITKPKPKKNIFTNYELTSILTRPTVRGNIKEENSVSDNKIANNNYLNLRGNTKNSPTKKKNDSRNSVDSNDKSKNKENKEINNNNIYQYRNTINTNNSLNLNSILIQKGLLIIATYINNKKGIRNEFTFHFNIDQLRKFQTMEVLVDKLSFFIKFIKINYDNETISFDFDSFNSFKENLWIKDMKKYNFKYLLNYKIIKEENKVEEIPENDDISIMKVFKGIKKHIQIKIEVKCPLILMKSLDDFGFNNSEKIYINPKVEKLLNHLTIINSLDLTKQIITILKENDFCRKDLSKKNQRRKTNRQKKATFKENTSYNEKLNNFESSGKFLGIVPDIE